MIARRRWLGAEPSKSPGLILSAQISASLNSGKIRPVKYGATLADHGGREASPGRRRAGRGAFRLPNSGGTTGQRFPVTMPRPDMKEASN